MVYHYTIAERLPSILREGLRVADAFVDASEKPVVWLTTSEGWEPTANKMACTANSQLRRLSREETEELGQGLVKIGLERNWPTASWKEWRDGSGVDPKMAASLKRTAKIAGSDVSHWRVSFEPVPPAASVSVDIFDRGRWRDFNDVYAERVANEV